MIDSTTIDTQDFFENSLKEILISDKRKILLTEIAKKITEIYANDAIVNINFICTHNSRRSQLAQVWAFYASNYYHFKNIVSFSGGTETTAFNRNTVLTLKEVGFQFDIVDFCHQNPKYSITFKGSNSQLLGYSKIFDDAHNTAPFIAITTCSSADENCPFIPEATARFHLPFVDPKHADNTEEVSKVYLETNKQIAAEIHFIFKNIASLIS